MPIVNRPGACTGVDACNWIVNARSRNHADRALPAYESSALDSGNCEVAHKSKGSSTANALFIFFLSFRLNTALARRPGGYVGKERGEGTSAGDVPVTLRFCLVTAELAIRVRNADPSLEPKLCRRPAG